jgi:hypothetical protein
VVLYDAAADGAVYVPASSMILHVGNCLEMPDDPVCALASIDNPEGQEIWVVVVVVVMILVFRPLMKAVARWRD